jgi:hypothetical protein
MAGPAIPTLGAGRPLKDRPRSKSLSKEARNARDREKEEIAERHRAMKRECEARQPGWFGLPDDPNTELVLTSAQAEIYDRLVQRRAPRIGKALPIEGKAA